MRKPSFTESLRTETRKGLQLLGSMVTSLARTVLTYAVSAGIITTLARALGVVAGFAGAIYTFTGCAGIIAAFAGTNSAFVVVTIMLAVNMTVVQVIYVV